MKMPTASGLYNADTCNNYEVFYGSDSSSSYSPSNF
jgi:hypothetical protein